MRKQELLVTSNFSFSHNVFHSYISLVHQNAVLCGNGLRAFAHENLSIGKAINFLPNDNILDWFKLKA